MIYSIFDSLLDAVLVLNHEGCLVYGNQTASQLFDVSQRRLHSLKPLSGLVEFEDKEFFLPERLAQVQLASAYREMAFVCKSGKEGWGQVSIQPNSLEGEQHFVLYIRDVTLEQDLQRKYRGELEQKEQVILDLQKAQSELENYSKNLEKMVEARTLELSEANRLLSAILNSLGQGFLVFDANGLCQPVYSAICLSILETIPAGRPIEDVLRIAPHEREDFITWRTTLFEEPIPFEDLTALGPQLFAHSKDWRVELEFYPMRSEQGKLTGVVLVANNKTAEFKARKEAEKERHLVQMILKIMRGKRQFGTFVREARVLIAQLQKAAAQETVDFNQMAYYLHTLKGGAGSFSLKALHDVAHECEDQIALIVREPQTPETRLEKVRHQVRDMAKELRVFLDQYGVLVGSQIEDGPRRVEIPATDLLSYADLLPPSQAERLRDYVREPFASAFDHYQTLLQDLAIAQSKQVGPLKIEGGDLRLYHEPYQEFFASLVHVFRNSVDHGLELPQVRQEAGKPAQNTVRIKAELAHTRLRIAISDDGRGIDPERIRAKLQELKIEVAGQSDSDVLQAIFNDGFSTRTEVSHLSGRGVGLAAVKHACENLGGSVRVESTPGQGTVFQFELPYFSQSSLKAA